MNETPHCGVCGHHGDNTRFIAREMLLGTRDEFPYFQCAHCGCVQIAAVPENLGDYYPSEYFSFRSRHRLAASRARRYFDGHRVRHALAGPDWLGALANRIAKPLDYLEWVGAAEISINARILDVGCGSGKLLLRMALGGFPHCTGVDPFIDEDIHYANGVKIYKTTAQAHARRKPAGYDFIMLHHAFEHAPDPLALMKALRGLLAAGGRVLLRVPVADSAAWKRYREHWVQLDAPRHLYLHTQHSIALLACDAGLRVERTVHDSTAFQFTGSELYARDIPMNAPRERKAIFDARTIAHYAAEARRLNREGKGDQAAFYLAAP